jgi:hypothetical protein
MTPTSLQDRFRWSREGAALGRPASDEHGPQQSEIDQYAKDEPGMEEQRTFLRCLEEIVRLRGCRAQRRWSINRGPFGPFPAPSTIHLSVGQAYLTERAPALRRQSRHLALALFAGRRQHPARAEMHRRAGQTAVAEMRAEQLASLGSEWVSPLWRRSYRRRLL